MQPSNPGRPRSAEVTESIHTAARKIMGTEGFGKLTVEAVITAAGATRPAFYRRYLSIAHLALDVIRQEFGVGTIPDSGTLREDLLLVQRDDIAMFTSNVMRNSLPGLFESMRLDPTLAECYQEDFVAPRRNKVRIALERADARSEIALDRFDVNLVCDLLVGPLLARSLFPVPPMMDDDFAAETVDAVCAYLMTTR